MANKQKRFEIKNPPQEVSRVTIQGDGFMGENLI
jgi:hypothetical protein